MAKIDQFEPSDLIILPLIGSSVETSDFWGGGGRWMERARESGVEKANPKVFIT